MHKTQLPWRLIIIYYSFVLYSFDYTTLTIISCNDGRLELLPKATGGIVVEAGNPTAPFYQMRFEACGKNFLLGPDGPCTYCPTIVPREACPPGEDTIFFPGTSMVKDSLSIQRTFCTM